GRAKAREARSQGRDVEPCRGRILDADGVALAYDRSILRLGFNPEEWTTRSRWRCRACGALHFRRAPPWTKAGDGGVPRPASPPSSCSCGAQAAGFADVPDEDLAPPDAAL